jgi:sec-independent protein translocase protein TatA
VLANLSGFHLLIVVGVVVLLFGASKLPLLAKNLGQSAKILKSEMKSLHDEDAEPVPVAAGDAAPAPSVTASPDRR